MKRPPELVMAKRESCGKGDPVPRVQLMRGFGCPETPHSKVTLSPISTSVFCGWITKVGLAGRKRELQKPGALVLISYEQKLIGLLMQPREKSSSSSLTSASLL